MRINIIRDYEKSYAEFSGSRLTEELIKKCIMKERGISCRIERTEKGKPLACANDGRQLLHVSVSHSDNIFACAIADFNIGLDIQSIRDIDTLKVAERYYSSEELKLVKSDPDEFFRIWVRKEAHSKYTGEGLSEIMRGIDVLSGEGTSFIDYVWSPDFGKVYHLAVCCDKNADAGEIELEMNELL